MAFVSRGNRFHNRVPGLGNTLLPCLSLCGHMCSQNHSPETPSCPSSDLDLNSCCWETRERPGGCGRLNLWTSRLSESCVVGVWGSHSGRSWGLPSQRQGTAWKGAGRTGQGEGQRGASHHPWTADKRRWSRQPHSCHLFGTGTRAPWAGRVHCLRHCSQWKGWTRCCLGQPRMLDLCLAAGAAA